MRIPKLLASSFLSFVALAGISASAQTRSETVQHKASCSVPKDEMELYANYLSPETHSSALTVVVTTTQPSKADIDSINLRLAAQGRGIPPDVRADFKQKDKSTCSIEPFPSASGVRFISKTEAETIFKVGWTEFHKRYGKGASRLQFSRVGFNVEKTLALLHVSSGIGPMAAGGVLYLFERKAGKWVVKTSIQTWTT
jgi:hypothetical protein